jgi:thioredoxin-related protein
VSVSLILISFLALSACTENSEEFKDKQTCKVSQTLFFVFLRSNCCFFTLLKEKGKFISEIRGFSHWWLWTFAHFL